MQTRSRLTLNRETLQRLTSDQVGAAFGGDLRNLDSLMSAGRGLCSVGAGSLGNSLTCTSWGGGCNGQPSGYSIVLVSPVGVARG